MKTSRIAKIALATFAVYSALQFGEINYAFAGNKVKEETTFVDESSELKESYDFLKKEVERFSGNIKEHNTKAWKNMEKLYSSAILNEEIGVGIVFYKYKHREDLAYLIVVNTDYLQTGKKDDNFKILGEIIITTNIDYLNSELEKYCKYAEEIYQKYLEDLTDIPKEFIVLDGGYSGTNVDFDMLKETGILYFGVPYSEKGKGAGSLIFILNFENAEGKVSVIGTGKGGIVLENPF